MLKAVCHNICTIVPLYLCTIVPLLFLLSIHSYPELFLGHFSLQELFPIQELLYYLYCNSVTVYLDIVTCFIIDLTNIM
jgi:hypothetical protein